MIPILAAAVTLVGGYAFAHRGKAHVGDTVDFKIRPGGDFGDQSVTASGKVIRKEVWKGWSPVYTVQLFSVPKTASPELELLGNLAAVLPNTVENIKDDDITKIVRP